MLSPLRVNTRCGATLVMMYRSPGETLFGPASPLPRTSTRVPVSTPAGIRTLTVSYFGNAPRPWQLGQGGRRLPVPLQSAQFWSYRKNPPPLETLPVPLQVWHETNPVAASPNPWQRAQASLRRTLILVVKPLIASSKLSASGSSISAPRRDCGRACVVG